MGKCFWGSHNRLNKNLLSCLSFLFLKVGLINSNECENLKFNTKLMEVCYENI